MSWGQSPRGRSVRTWRYGSARPGWSYPSWRFPGFYRGDAKCRTSSRSTRGAVRHGRGSDSTGYRLPSEDRIPALGGRRPGRVYRSAVKLPLPRLDQGQRVSRTRRRARRPTRPGADRLRRPPATRASSPASRLLRAAGPEELSRGISATRSWADIDSIVRVSDPGATASRYAPPARATVHRRGHSAATKANVVDPAYIYVRHEDQADRNGDRRRGCRGAADVAHEPRSPS